uniref:Uncharacterized protein n=1 Tax=Sipha flava TaxID=143950 RepID=A0A2S2Q0H9_9HEMI
MAGGIGAVGIFEIISVWRRRTLTNSSGKNPASPRVIVPLGALQVPAGQWLAAKARSPAKIRYTLWRGNASTRKYSARVTAAVRGWLPNHRKIIIHQVQMSI